MDEKAKDFTRNQLQPAAKKAGDGALDAAGRFRSTAQDTAQQIDDRSAPHRIASPINHWVQACQCIRHSCLFPSRAWLKLLGLW